MAIAYDEVLEGRGRCPVHLQLEADEVQPPSTWPGAARVVGRVMRVFRGSVALGSSLTLTLDVIRPGDQQRMGDFDYAWEDAEKLRFLELFLDHSGGELRVPSNSYTAILDELTEAPQLAWSTASPRPSWPARLFRRLARR